MTILNNCPVCGRPRGDRDFSHGECFIKEAKRLDEYEKTTSAGMDGDLSRITLAQKKSGSRKKIAKRYLSGKLPGWMYS